MDSAFGKDEFETPPASGAWGTEPETPRGKFDPLEFVQSYKTKADGSARSRPSKFVELLVEASRRIFKQFFEFAKQAVELAISKFLVELCAMIIAGISAAMMNKHKRGVDISTPNVFYNQDGQKPSAPQAGSQGSLWDTRSNNSFDGGSWNNRSSQPAW